MDTPRSDDADDHGARPGVEPRTAYVYQRWHRGTASDHGGSSNQYATNGNHSPPLDTVEPPAQPVLANYDLDTDAGVVQPAVDGRAESSTGGDSSTHEPAAPPLPADEADTDPATLAARYMYEVLRVNGVDFDDDAATSIPTMYRECRSQGDIFQSEPPNIGDLVFFHNTYDANDDGRNNNWYTQVGIIQDIATDGTVEFLTIFNGDVQPLRMNLDQIEDQTDATGRTINSQLRAESSDDPPYTQYLAGQLFASYCDILGDRRELILIDEWP